MTLDGATFAALIGLIGIGLGGGIQALANWATRRAEAKAVLSALVSEVEAVARLIHHRGFRNALLGYHAQATQLVQSGQPDAPIPTLMISAEYNYFASYDALIEKIGLLDPYFADRITRFYTLIKAAHENYLPTSPHQTGMMASEGAVLLANDVMLLDTIMILAAQIATFRKAMPPRGIVDPFLNLPTTDGPWDYLNRPVMSIDAPFQHEPPTTETDKMVAEEGLEPPTPGL